MRSIERRVENDLFVLGAAFDRHFAEGGVPLGAGLGGQPLELYHLVDDPYERRDLAAARPEVLDRTKAALRAQVQRGGSVPASALARPNDDAGA